MAMTGSALATARLQAIAALTPNEGETAAAFRARVFAADSEAIVTYIQANAEIATVVSVSGVTVGPAIAAGTGTGSIA